ncbi:MAG: 4Fe-4S dicluster domain-containing protein [Blastocatellia bacterium]|nr:4Fe-4S dicluster domain-containing protein [Blastocatellia bacterium]
MNQQKRRQPIVEAPKRPRGRVTVLEGRCKGCEFCVEFCPKDVLAMSPKFNAKGYHFPVAVRAEECVNCQLCYYLCPEFAIFVTAVNERNENRKNRLLKEG